MKSNLVDIDVVVVHETPDAFLVKWDPDRDAVWLPKSACEFQATDGSDIGILTLPERLAEEKELL